MVEQRTDDQRCTTCGELRVHCRCCGVDARPSNLRDECPHGSLRRQSEVCERDDEITRLRATERKFGTLMHELMDERDRLRAEAQRLRAICAAAYQMAGAYDAPVRFLDALALHDEYLEMTPDQIIDALLPVESPDETEKDHG